eukprot:s8410_g1.t1
MWTKAVSREPAVVQKGKGTGGDLSSITDSTNRMDVDEGGAPIRNPKAESYVPKLPAIDGAKMSKGRRSEIEGWADFLEQFLPWIALFDDRIPEELHRATASEDASSRDLGQRAKKARVSISLGACFRDVVNFNLVETDETLEEVKWTRALEMWMFVIMEDAECSALQKFVLWLHQTNPGARALPKYEEMLAAARNGSFYPDLTRSGRVQGMERAVKVEISDDETGEPGLTSFASEGSFEVVTPGAVGSKAGDDQVATLHDHEES